MRTFSSERLESTYSSLDQHFGAYLLSGKVRLRAARLNLIEDLLRRCAWSLEKQILSATYKERRCEMRGHGISTCSFSWDRLLDR
jgi:hypothetical protein